MKASSRRKLPLWPAALVAAALLLGACTSIRETRAPALGAHDAVAIAPIANFTETPAAGGSAAAIAAGVLRANGLTDVRLAPAEGAANALFDTAQRDTGERRLAWAREHHVRFVLGGSVEEWRYKAGVDGEPVAGVTFELIDVDSGQVVWTATGTRSGWSRSSLSSVASSLIGSLLAPLRPRS
jgi:TolB-like protein